MARLSGSGHAMRSARKRLTYALFCVGTGIYTLANEQAIPVGRLPIVEASQAYPRTPDFSVIPDSATVGTVIPIIWSGSLRDAKGEPTSGSVTLAIRPSAAQIDQAFRSSRPMPPVIPVAKGIVGPDGFFTLRAQLPADVPRDYSADSWVNMLLVATNGDEIRIYTDSMYWDPDPLSANSRWLTSPSAKLAREAHQRETSSASRSELVARRAAVLERLERDLASTEERPAEVEFGPTRPPSGELALQPIAFGRRPLTEFAQVAPPSPYILCVVLDVVDTTSGYQTVADIDQAEHWQSLIKYKQTTSSSFEVGFSSSGVAPWSVAGSASFSDSFAGGFDTLWPNSPSTGPTATSFKVEVNFDKIQWQCASTSQPGPYYVYTSEPTAWLGGTRNEDDPTILCGSGHTVPVAGGTTLYKDNASHTTYSASGGAYGFYGRATVGYSAEIQLGWKNNLDTTREICGETGSPLVVNTRVVALTPK